MTETIENNVGEGTIYEFSSLFVPELDSAALSQIVDSITKKITDLEGEIISSGEPVYIKLAYQVQKSINNKIKKVDFAHFAWVKFALAPNKLATFEKFVKEVLNESVMRYMIIKTIRENTQLTQLSAAELTMADEALIESVEAEAATTVDAVEPEAVTDLGEGAVVEVKEVEEKSE